MTSNEKQFHLLYLAPEDRAVEDAYVQAVQNSVRDLQKWFYFHTGGSTFVMKDIHPEVVECTGYSSKTLGEMAAINGALDHFAGDRADEFCIFFVDAPVTNPMMDDTTVILGEEFLKGLLGSHEKVKYRPRWTGELGFYIAKALGVPVLSESHSDWQSSLLGDGYRNYPNCFLHFKALQYIKELPYFSTDHDPKKMIYYPYTKETYFYGNASNGGGFFVRNKYSWNEFKYQTGVAYDFVERFRDNSIIIIKDVHRGISVRLSLIGGPMAVSTNLVDWEELGLSIPGYNYNNSVLDVPDIEYDHEDTVEHFKPVPEGEGGSDADDEYGGITEDIFGDDYVYCDDLMDESEDDPAAALKSVSEDGSEESSSDIDDLLSEFFD